MEMSKLIIRFLRNKSPAEDILPAEQFKTSLILATLFTLYYEF